MRRLAPTFVLALVALAVAAVAPRWLARPVAPAVEPAPPQVPIPELADPPRPVPLPPDFWIDAVECGMG